MSDGNYERSLAGYITYPGFTGTPVTGFTSRRYWTGTNFPKQKPFYRPTSPVSGRIGHSYRRPARPKRSKNLDPHPYDTFGYRSVNLIPAGIRNGSSGLYTGVWQMSPVLSSGIVAGADPWSANDDLVLISKLREEVLGGDFDLGVFLAECPQAFKLIGDSALRLSRAYSLARKGNFKAAARLLTDGKGLSNRTAKTWLELQYGWKPLLQDIYGAMVYIDRQLGEPTFRASVTRQLPDYDPVVTFWQGSYNGASAALACKSSYGVRRKRLLALLKPSGINPMAVVDPATIVWEKLPFSFIFDWIVPVGNYLQGLQTRRALSGTFVTSSTWRVRGSGPYRVVSSLGTLQSFPDSSGWIESYVFKRTVTSSIPMPSISMKGIRRVASLDHAMNGLALLHSLGPTSKWAPWKR